MKAPDSPQASSEGSEDKIEAILMHLNWAVGGTKNPYQPVKEATHALNLLLQEARIDEVSRPLLEQASAGLKGEKLDIYFLLRTRLDELEASLEAEKEKL